MLNLVAIAIVEIAIRTFEPLDIWIRVMKDYM